MTLENESGRPRSPVPHAGPLAIARLSAPAGLSQIAQAASDAAADVVLFGGDLPELPEPPAEPLVIGTVDVAAATPEAACRGIAGPARDELGFVGCAADPRRTRELLERLDAVANRCSGVLIDGLDRTSRLPAFDGGACAACLLELDTALRRTWGPPERFTAPDLPEAWRAAARLKDREPVDFPFGREHLLGRFRHPREQARTLVTELRDRARAAGRECLVAARAAGLSPLLPRLARLCDLLLLAEAGPSTGRLALELALAAAPRKALVLESSPARELGVLAREAHMAAALGADLLLPAAAPEPAVAAARVLRTFRRELPQGPTAVADAAVIYDPRCDVLTDGRHGLLSDATCAALSAAGYLVTACERVKDAPSGAAVFLAGAQALPARELKALLSRVEAGGSAASFGELGAVDDEALPVAGHLPRLAPGENRVGRGRLHQASAGDEVAAAMLRACRALVPDALRIARVAGRGKVLCVARRAPGAELAAQLHLANLDLAGDAFVPPQGLVLHLGGVLRDARRGVLRAPGGLAEKVTVNASARGTSCVLPRLPPYAVLLLE